MFPTSLISSSAYKQLGYLCVAPSLISTLTRLLLTGMMWSSQCWYDAKVHVQSNVCVSSLTENVAMCREPGGSITLVCSAAGCPSSIEKSVAMYLYRDFKERYEVLYYSSNQQFQDKVILRNRYVNRTQTVGLLRNHNITISQLTVDDSGVYSCVYKDFPSGEVRCNVYAVVVGGEFFQDQRMANPLIEVSTHLSL